MIKRDRLLKLRKRKYSQGYRLLDENLIEKVVRKIKIVVLFYFSKHSKKLWEKKGEGIHHIAFEVADIISEMERLKSEGFILLNEVPKKGADNKLVCILHPKGTNSVLVELCQGI